MAESARELRVLGTGSDVPIHTRILAEARAEFAKYKVDELAKSVTRGLVDIVGDETDESIVFIHDNIDPMIEELTILPGQAHETAGDDGLHHFLENSVGLSCWDVDKFIKQYEAVRGEQGIFGLTSTFVWNLHKMVHLADAIPRYRHLDVFIKRCLSSFHWYRERAVELHLTEGADVDMTNLSFMTDARVMFPLVREAVSLLYHLKSGRQHHNATVLSEASILRYSDLHYRLGHVVRAICMLEKSLYRQNGCSSSESLIRTAVVEGTDMDNRREDDRIVAAIQFFYKANFEIVPRVRMLLEDLIDYLQERVPLGYYRSTPTGSGTDE